MSAYPDPTPGALGELAAALAKAQGAMEPATKDSKNAERGTRYADFASIWRACRKPLADNNLAVVQAFLPGTSGVELVTTLIHSSGQSITSRLPVPGTVGREGSLPLQPAKGDALTLGAAIGYARRYALAALVGVVVDDEPSDATQRQRQERRPREEAPPAPIRSADEVAQEVVLWRARISAAEDFDALDKILADLKREIPPPARGQPWHPVALAVVTGVKTKRTQLADGAPQ